MSEWPGPIFALTLFAEDLAEATRFYTEVFGLPVVFEDGNSAVFQLGETLVNLLAVSQAPRLVGPAPIAPPDAGVRSRLTLKVADVDAMCAGPRAPRRHPAQRADGPPVGAAHGRIPRPDRHGVGDRLPVACGG